MADLIYELLASLPGICLIVVIGGLLEAWVKKHSASTELSDEEREAIEKLKRELEAGGS